MQIDFNVPEAEIIKWRRHLHAHPELSYKEFETANYVADALNSFGCITVRGRPPPAWLD